MTKEELITRFVTGDYKRKTEIQGGYYRTEDNGQSLIYRRTLMAVVMEHAGTRIILHNADYIRFNRADNTPVYIARKYGVPVQSTSFNALVNQALNSGHAWDYHAPTIRRFKMAFGAPVADNTVWVKYQSPSEQGGELLATYFAAQLGSSKMPDIQPLDNATQDEVLQWLESAGFRPTECPRQGSWLPNDQARIVVRNASKQPCFVGVGTWHYADDMVFIKQEQSQLTTIIEDRTRCCQVQFDRYFWATMDEGIYCIIELDPTRYERSISLGLSPTDAAQHCLQPDEVQSFTPPEAGVLTARQGEWYFVPWKKIREWQRESNVSDAVFKAMSSGMVMLPGNGGNRHVSWTPLQKIRQGKLFTHENVPVVFGKVKHVQPRSMRSTGEHRNIILHPNYLYKAYRNTEYGSSTIRHRID